MTPPLPVRRITDPDDLAKLIEAAEGVNSTDLRCAMDAPVVPPVEVAQRFLDREGYVTLACFGQEGRPLIWCTLHRHDGKIIWLVPCLPWEVVAPPMSLDSPYTELVIACEDQSDTGECWGEVENEELHERFLATSAFAFRDGNRSVLRREQARPGAPIDPVQLEEFYQRHPERRPVWPHERPPVHRPGLASVRGSR